MEFKTIKKDPDAWPATPNLMNYPQVYADFAWEQIHRELDGLPDGGGINIAHEAVDRHANGPLQRQAGPALAGAKMAK